MPMATDRASPTSYDGYQETPVSLTPFHIAFPVDNLDAARTFYGTTLGCPESPSSAQWIDWSTNALNLGQIFAK